MDKIRHPMKRSLLWGIALFTVVLCICLIGAQYFSIRKTLYTQYQNRINNILKYAESAIDPDDLAECIRTGNESAKFRESQKFIDRLKEMTGVHYLYVIIPLNTEATDNIRNVMAAVTPDEYANEPEAIVQLNALSGDAYSADTAKKYYDAYYGEGERFFVNTTAFGTDYTGMHILVDSQGNRVAAACADFDMAEIRSQLWENMLNIITIIAVVTLLFTSAFMVWMDMNIISPIRKLEKEVRNLAEKSHGQRNPDALTFKAPEIRTGNEVESLSRTIEGMYLDVKEYVQDLLEQEKELAKLSTMANRDSLTHVGNKNAYDSFSEALQLKLSEGPQEFSILVLNANGLRKINDVYGHDKGDLYLIKACRILCEVFRHTPVFRLSGDEFAAVMSGDDYRNRAELVKQARNELRAAMNDETAAPWERVSAAIGIADYDRKTDRTVEDVMGRAAWAMKEEKARSRKQ